MRSLLLVALLSVAYISTFGDVVLDYGKDDRFLDQQKTSIISLLIASKCPDVNVSLSQTYRQLFAKLVECDRPVEQTTTPKDPVGKDCQDYFEQGETQSGIYYIRPSGSVLPAFSVWCTFGQNRGWTVIQRNLNGAENFDRLWHDYKKGFGDITGEHYLGNEKIHLLTQTNQKLNIYLTSAVSGSASGNWKKFIVADEANNYRLTIDGHGYSGGLLDSFSPNHNGMMFSTADNDNDVGKGNRSCAAEHKGGWWYVGCGDVGLNSESYNGIYWRHYPAKASVMRISRD